MMDVGLFGKLPAEGDFVSRRLPWEFTSAWDAWLQAGLWTAKEQLGSKWLNLYLTAPVWRFQLRPGLAGPHGWLGFWFPSVDRVGRYFPLTLAMPLPPHRQNRCVLLEEDAELQRLEDRALKALDPKMSFAQLDALIATTDLRFLQSAASPLPPGTGSGVQSLSFPAQTSAEEVQAACIAIPPRAVCLFTWGSDSVTPALLNLDALPLPSDFNVFFEGTGREPVSCQP